MARVLLALTLASALASPALARTDAPPARAPAPAPAPASVPAPAPAGASRPAPGPGGVPAPGGSGYAYGSALYAAPFWLGWSWGWGFYPLWGPRPGWDGYEAYAAPGADASRVTAQIAFTGAAATNGAAGGTSLRMDGRTLGFQLGADAFAVAPPGQPLDAAGALGYVTAHVTWSVLAQDAGRIRLELGLASLAMPTDGQYAGEPYAGTTAFGPDVGVSGHLALVGPLGIEGHARYTPYPVPVADLRLALAVRGGPWAVTAGWRTLDVEGDGTRGPVARFGGPEIGLALALF